MIHVIIKYYLDNIILETCAFYNYIFRFLY